MHDLLQFYMGKNTPERQDFIIENLRVEEDIVEDIEKMERMGEVLEEIELLAEGIEEIKERQSVLE